MNTVNPNGIDPRDWMDIMGRFLAPFSVSVYKVERGDQWREWGSHVRQSLVRRGIIIPIPDQYLDWRDWADAFNLVVQKL